MRPLLDLRCYRWGLWPDDLPSRCRAQRPGTRVTCELPPDHVMELPIGRRVLELGHLGRDHRQRWHYWAGALDEYQGTGQDPQRDA